MRYLSECLIIRDENQYLVEHIEKGAAAGVEHFYIYDNMSATPVADFLASHDAEAGGRLSGMCTVEVFPSTHMTQLDCYRKFLADHRRDTKWCAFIDTDEMLEGSLSGLCGQNEDFLCLRLRQVGHGANGQAYADFSRTLTERFQPHILTKFHMWKCVSQVEYVASQGPHNTTMAPTDIPMRRWLRNVGYNETCQLHHYFYKSFEEWLMKVRRGNVLSQYGWRVGEFFAENSIPDGDRDALLSEYGLSLGDRMLYSEKKRKSKKD